MEKLREISLLQRLNSERYLQKLFEFFVSFSLWSWPYGIKLHFYIKYFFLKQKGSLRLIRFCFSICKRFYF